MVKSSEHYEPVIGVEVHAQLLTRSKAFCGCSTGFGADPNTNVCPVCLGLPGALPVLNRELVESVLKIGVALGCRIAMRSVFARKNYFYPDLPKGYQISQYEQPICAGGSLEIDLDDGTRKSVGILRIHMEEDAGKSIHDARAGTLIDLNRSGVPLIEIVSAPEIRSPREAYRFVMKMRQIVTYLGICDGNMEEGSLRCDANVSVRRKGAGQLGTKTELKNMNSFRHVERALEFEIDRQIGLLEEGWQVVQETLLWDENQSVAVPMRSKEEAHDYRYFPEPDLVPVAVDEDWIERVRGGLPELPTARRDRFVGELGLPAYDADVLTSEKDVADYFESVLAALRAEPRLTLQEDAKAVSNWVMTEVLRAAAGRKIPVSGIHATPEQLAALIGLIRQGTVSTTIAKEVFGEMLSSGGDPAAIIRQKGMVQVSDEAAIEGVAESVLGSHPAQVETYLKGNEKVFGFLVGETMRAMNGKANPRLVNDILRRLLTARRV